MNRLDEYLVRRGLAATRSHAENLIKLGYVTVDGRQMTKAGYNVPAAASVQLDKSQQYVSRAAYKLESVADTFDIDFRDKTVLDIGSSTGGFSDYALRAGAKKVIAVDVGTEQLHPTLRTDGRIELHEKTDIRSVTLSSKPGGGVVIEPPDIILIDVSFVSLRTILAHVASLSSAGTVVIAMCKPQFEAGKHQVNKGVIKNSAMRRDILKDFEAWLRGLFIMKAKADSGVAGAKGNLERFYLLKKL